MFMNLYVLQELWGGGVRYIYLIALGMKNALIEREMK